MTRLEEKTATRQRILSACVKLFIEKGYHKTTLSEIVKDQIRIFIVSSILFSLNRKKWKNNANKTFLIFRIFVSVLDYHKINMVFWQNGSTHDLILRNGYNDFFTIY